MEFTLKPYKDLIALSKEKVDEALAPLRARKAKAKANLKASEIDEQLATLASTAQELAVSKDVDFDRLADKLDEIALLELRKTRLGEIIAQLFPTE